MSKVQQCKNVNPQTNEQCKVMIQVMQDPSDGKFKPYQQGEDNEPVLHNCPYSPYNLKKQQAASVPAKQEESSVQYQILQEIRKTNEFLERTNRLLLKIAGIEE